jgi:hypothetical protein
MASNTAARLVNLVDQRALVVALETFNGKSQPLAMGHAFGLHIGQGGCTIDLGLACAEQVEVGAVEDEQGLHGRVWVWWSRGKYRWQVVWRSLVHRGFVPCRTL